MFFNIFSVLFCWFCHLVSHLNLYSDHVITLSLPTTIRTEKRGHYCVESPPFGTIFYGSTDEWGKKLVVDLSIWSSYRGYFALFCTHTSSFCTHCGSLFCCTKVNFIEELYSIFCYKHFCTRQSNGTWKFIKGNFFLRGVGKFELSFSFSINS